MQTRHPPAPPLPTTASDDHGVVRSTLDAVPAVRRVLPGYVAGLARDVGQLTDHLAAGRRGDVRRLAHQLRGSGGSYGFPDVTRLAMAAEAAVDAGHGADVVVADVARLVGLIRRIDGYDPAGERAAPPPTPPGCRPAVRP